jgi:hypothetical protein
VYPCPFLSFSLSLLCVTLSAALMTAFATTSRGEEDDVAEDRPVLVAGQDLKSQLDKYKRAALYLHPQQPAVFAANCEDDPGWWGRFSVFHEADGKIDWVAKMPPLYLQWEGMFIVSLAWRQFERPNLTVLEVVTSTHMGNGFLWLFALDGHQLRPLLHTPALGFADSPALRKDLPAGETKFTKPVTIRYSHPKFGGGDVTVQLTGTVVVENADTGQLLARKPIRQVWIWDAKDRVFLPEHHTKKKGARKTVRLSGVWVLLILPLSSGSGWACTGPPPGRQDMPPAWPTAS